MPPRVTRRTYRDKFLFALAYGAIVAAILFTHPFGKAPNAADSTAQKIENAGY